MGIAHLNMGMKKDPWFGWHNRFDASDPSEAHGLHPNTFLLRSIGDDVAIPLQGMARPMLSVGHHVLILLGHPEPGIIVGPQWDGDGVDPQLSRPERDG